MAVLGLIVGFLLAFRGVRNVIWVVLAYAFLRSDPLNALFWCAFILAAMLAWKLLKDAAGEARAERPGG